jgi:PAS domain S-box-containing protein
MPDQFPQGLDSDSVYRALFEASPDALLLVGAGGRILLCSPMASVLLGYDIDTLQGMQVDQLVPDAIRPKHASYRQGYSQQPRSRPMGTHTGLVARRQDGSEVVVEIALSPLLVQGQHMVVAAVRDIGAYPRVRHALQRARYGEHLALLGRQAADSRDPQLLLDSVPQIASQALEVGSAVVLLLDHEGTAMRVASVFGAGPGEAVGDKLPLDKASLPGCVLTDGLPLMVNDLGHEPGFAATRQQLDAGLRSALAVPVSDRGSTIGAVVVRSHQPGRFGDEELRFLGSVASLLATSLQRSKTEEALNHAQRLESVGQLTGGIAHDFNNLLTVIQGNLQVIEELPALAHDSAAQQWVAAATRAARRGAELTGKLLAFSRRQVLQPQTVDVAGLLDSLAGMLNRTLDQRIAIVVEHAKGCPALRADPGQLESALLNIAINARDAMRDGGTLRFASSLVHKLPDDVVGGDDGSTAGGPWVAIAVADSGCGMDDAVRERAFEPFFTTKEAGRGTGLGLSTVYGFVKQSSGAVGIRSAPGRGTEVTLFIPQAAEAHALAAAHVDGMAVVPPGLRVLLVEDDPEVRNVVHTALQLLGCDTRCAGSGEEALSLLDQGGQGQDPQLLLSDIALGAGMRGTQLAQAVQARLPALAVVLMSGFSEDLLEADRDAPPRWELLPKPFSREALARALARALHEEVLHGQGRCPAS